MDSKRLVLLDELRGFTLISMMLYHSLWDLVYIAGISIPWYKSTGAHLWQQSICWTFIFLSGFCWSLGHHPLKRGLLVFFAGTFITLVTYVLLPENIVIFGVLTLIGSSMLLMIPLDGLLRKIRSPLALWILFSTFFFLFLLFLPARNGHLGNFVGLLCGSSFHQGGLFLPRELYRNLMTAYLGFPVAAFYSTDYFPIIPWYFLYITGYLFYRLGTCLGWLDNSFLKCRHFTPFAFIGRRSLLVYMLHQPILYAITLLIILFR